MSSASKTDGDNQTSFLPQKVQQIEKLKEQQAAGKEMEKNQIDKIQTLGSLLQEIEELQIS